MKIGDRIKVIKVEEADNDCIDIGMTGTIIGAFPANDGKENDEFDVDLDQEIRWERDKNHNINIDGSYQLCRNQIEVIEEKERTGSETKNH